MTDNFSADTGGSDILNILFSLVSTFVTNENLKSKKESHWFQISATKILGD